MAVKTAAKLRKKAAKVKKRNEHEKAWRQKKATPRVLESCDYEVFWVLSGESLDRRPGPMFSPRPPPDSAKSGRWISRRHVQVDDVLLLKRGESAKLTSLPASLGEEPRLLQLTRMYEFSTDRSSMIRCTPKHPFYVRDKGWTSACDLQPGDLLMTPAGDCVPVDRTEDRGEVEPVYNLHVADCHTYFVTGADGGPAILVHNQSGGTTAGATRSLTKEEKQFILNVVKAIFFPSLADIKASGDAGALDRYNKHVAQIQATLDNATLHSGSGASIVAKATFADQNIAGITLEGRHIYFQVPSYPGATNPKGLIGEAARLALALIVHESVHLLQQKNDPTGYHFYAAYLLESALEGYEGVSSEVEAYAVELAVIALLKQDPSVFSRDFTDADIKFLKAEFARQKQIWMDKIKANKSP